MKSRLLLLGAAVLSVPLSAQTVTFDNTSNAAITPSAVVGDYLQVTISGAAANALVTLSYSQNGTPGTWNAGYTNGSGYWQDTEQVESYKIGIWLEQWAVGGTNLGPQYSLEVFDIPTSLTVATVGASNPDGCGLGYLNAPLANIYGPSASIEYQIVGSTGSGETVPSTGLGVMLYPIEVGSFYTNTGGTIPYGPGPVGTSSNPWSPPSSQYAASNGTFYDVPVSACYPGAFSSYLFNSQTISIQIGNNPYQVRSTDYYAGSSAAYHGSMYNSNGDVSYTQ